MKKMKAAYIESFDGIDAIKVGELPIPEPEAGQVQIKVAFAGINPVDWKITQGHFKGRIPEKFPLILGWDVAGTISALGAGVKGWQVGDTVFAYCRKEILHGGSYAEYICLDAKNISKKPESLTLAQAACIPLSALTAWQSLYDTAHIQSKESVLIHAGAGGVGAFAIQLAKLKGSTVITTSSESHHAYLKKLGADKIIDYVKENFVDAIHNTFPQGIDVVYDTVGGETLQKSYDALKEGGRLVTIAGSPDEKEAQKHRVEAKFVLVAPNGKVLEEIASLFDHGKLKAPPVEIFPLSEVKQALLKSKGRRVEGKMVLKIA
jgi:NADPH:quinone reductase-like Zn-dependent oxidoreductase